MPILFTIKNHLTILGILPVREQHFPEIFREYRLTFNTVHTLFILSMVMCYTSAVILFPFLRINRYEQYFQSVLYCSVSILRAILYSILISKKSDLSNLFDELANIIEKRSSKMKIREIYDQEITKAENFVKKFWKWISISIAFSILPKILVAIHGYFAFNHSTDSFQLIIPVVLPFMWTNLRDYLLITSTLAAWFFGGMLITVTTLEIVAGFSTLIKAFTMDIKQSLNDFNISIAGSDRNFNAKERIDIYQQFCEIIEFHCTAKEFTNRFSAFYGPVIATFFYVSSTSICASLLSLNAAFELHNTADVVSMIVGLSYVVLYIGIFCFFGEEVTKGFDEINEDIYECSWEDFAMELRKLFVTMLIGAQDPIYIHGYMNTRCTRQVFQSIFNGAYSYFSMLRGF
ncbi:odorant receptor 94a-like [Contarinia nasturtii]|uniref:odorant receptor 94a-like n=1 Tax=Contarinia nasturtii TaxID=265458 RepID=UPI0012D396AF|nr:odorant receptor 94a-like [Contarinia nasturtii]